MLAEEKGERQRIFSRKLYAEKNPRNAGWFEERLDLIIFAGKQVKILYKTQHMGGGSCASYCWADPVIREKPLMEITR